MGKSLDSSTALADTLQRLETELLTLVATSGKGAFEREAIALFAGSPAVATVPHILGVIAMTNIMAREPKLRGLGTKATWHKLVRMMEAQAAAHGGQAGPWLSEKLSQAKVRLLVCAGRHWEAMGAAAGEAGALLRVGAGPAALASLKSQNHAAQVQRTHILRLAGRAAEAASVLAHSGKGDPLIHEWEALCCAAQASGDVTPLLKAVRRKQALRRSRFLAGAGLWTLAMGAPQARERPFAIETLRRLAKRDGAGPYAADPPVVTAMAALLGAVDPHLPVATKTRSLLQILDGIHRIADLETVLLLYVAVARSLSGLGAGAAATAALAHYQGLCRQLSQGTFDDTLGVAIGISPPGWVTPPRHVAPRLVLDVIATSSVAQMMTLATAAASMGGTAARGRIKEWLAPEAGRVAIRRSSEQEMAGTLANALGRLKGPLTKIGQAGAFFAFALPEELVAALAPLQDASPPLAPDVIRKAVETYLRAPIDQVFRAWSEHPVAVGSIGQVHRATLPDGRDVAVKVQFPNIKMVVTSSLRVLPLIRAYLRRVFPHAGVDAVAAYVSKQFLDECDYRREAAYQERFRLLMADDAELLVPEVIASHTNQFMLTMDYVDGQRFDDFAAFASQAERDRAGTTMYRAMARAFLRHGLFAADPHPGNFLFLNGRVAQVDYGATTEFPAAFMRDYRRMLANLTLPAAQRDPGVWADLGFVADAATFDPMAQYEFYAALGRPYLGDHLFRFGPDHGRRQAALLAANPNLKSSRLPPEISVIMRFVWGQEGTLSALGAEVDCSRIVRETLAQAASGPAIGVA